MSRKCFEHLCEKIKYNVGAREFKSEAYLAEFGKDAKGNDLKTVNILRVHQATTGGFISGEIKVDLTLRLMILLSYLIPGSYMRTKYSTMSLRTGYVMIE